MINIKLNAPKESVKKFIDVQKTLNGDYILREHPSIDVVVMPEKSKILILSKDEVNENVYKIQEKLFSFLTKKGVILPDTIKGGNVFGSLEGTYPEMPPGGENPLQVVIFAVSNFIDQERPIYMYQQEYQDAMEDYLLNPDDKDSTELGEIPHKDKQGTIPDYNYRTGNYQNLFEGMNITIKGTPDEDNEIVEIKENDDNLINIKDVKTRKIVKNLESCNLILEYFYNFTKEMKFDMPQMSIWSLKTALKSRLSLYKTDGRIDHKSELYNILKKEGKIVVDVMSKVLYAEPEVKNYYKRAKDEVNAANDDNVFTLEQEEYDELNEQIDNFLNLINDTMKMLWNQ